MKRLTLKIAAVALVAFIASPLLPLKAMDSQTCLATEATLFENEVEWTQLELKDVPEAITKAAASKYEGSSVETAFKGNDNTYKLVLKTGETKVTAIFDAEGKFLKQE
ncbi:MAG: hypothetical protein QM786_18090 [Breznakibacter sp.]